MTPRTRRATDVVTVIAGVLLLLWALVGIDARPSWQQDITGFVTDAPTWVAATLALGYGLAFAFGIGVIVTLAIRRRRHAGALRDVLLAAVGSVVLGTAVTLIATGEWPYVLPMIGLDDPDPRFPVLRVVVITAVLMAASPHISKAMRRLGWLLIVLSGVAAVGLDYGYPADAIGSAGIGLIAAGVVLLVYGSPRGYPDPDEVTEALAGMGVPTADVTIDPQQSWGVRTLRATSEGTDISIKAYGRDAAESQWAAKLWRSLWYREDARTIHSSRVQAVEHEALVAVMAGRAGASVTRVLTAGRASPELAVLITTTGGVPMSSLEADQLPDDLLRAVWADVGKLHEAGISHGSLSTRAILIDGSHTLRDFTNGSLVAGESDRALDIVELLFSLSAKVGVDRAVASAVDGLGAPQLESALPYLQLAAVSGHARRQADGAKAHMADLQAAVLAATGAEMPEPARVRRVTTRNLLMSTLLLLAAWALIPLFAGIDYAEVWDELQGASWGIILVSLLVGQTIFLPQATAMMFAVPAPLPFWPLTILQVSVKFIGLAVPSAAGRVAMNAAFLHKFGMSVSVAITQGVVNGLADFVVQATVLLIAFFTTDMDLGIDFQGTDAAWGLILLIVALLIVSTVIAIVRIQRLHDRVMPALRQGWEALLTVGREPSRALGLLGSNLVYNVLQGVTLWLILEAMDAPISFGASLVVVIATTLLQGLVPIPGGVGVTEAVMTGFLAAVGVGEPAAFAATIVYRAITFYLPAAEGFFAMRWLESNEYL